MLHNGCNHQGLIEIMCIIIDQVQELGGHAFDGPRSHQEAYVILSDCISALLVPLPHLLNQEARRGEVITLQCPNKSPPDTIAL